MWKKYSFGLKGWRNVDQRGERGLLDMIDTICSGWLRKASLIPKSCCSSELEAKNKEDERVETTQQASVVKHPHLGCLLSKPERFGAPQTEAPHLANEVPDCLHTTPTHHSTMKCSTHESNEAGGRKTLLATDNLRLNSQPYETRA